MQSEQLILNQEVKFELQTSMWWKKSALSPTKHSDLH